ncbi:MAG: hypothetical protein ACPLX8_01080, partial [Nanopusillaceae archaeon]
KTTIFDLNLPNEITTTIPLAKDILPVLKMFVPEDDNKYVYFYVDQNKYIIEDEDTFVSNNKSDTMICNNPFIDDDRFSKYDSFMVNPISNFSFGEKIINRIITLVNVFDVLELKLNVKSGVAKLSLDTESKSKHSDIVSNLKVNMADGVYGVPTILFMVPWNSKGIDISIYKKSDDKYIFSSKGDILELPISLYSAIIAKKNVDKFSK